VWAAARHDYGASSADGSLIAQQTCDGASSALHPTSPPPPPAEQRPADQPPTTTAAAAGARRGPDGTATTSTRTVDPATTPVNVGAVVAAGAAAADGPLRRGDRVVLHGLQTVGNNGVVGVLQHEHRTQSGVRWKVAVWTETGDKIILVKPSNLIKWRPPQPITPDDHTEFHNTRRYLGGRYDIYRIPRWEGDGLSASVAAGATNPDQDSAALFPNPSPDQAEITRLLGSWPSGKSLEEYERSMGMAGGMHLPGMHLLMRSLPWSQQQQAAKQVEDEACHASGSDTFGPGAAVEYLCAHATDPAVSDLLVRMDAPKIARNPQRFPGLMPVLRQLAVHDLASDANLRLLFGDEARVRGTMMEVGAFVASPPPEDSPTHAQLSRVVVCLVRNSERRRRGARRVKLASKIPS
jgi:hypothetical protein